MRDRGLFVALVRDSIRSCSSLTMSVKLSTGGLRAASPSQGLPVGDFGLVGTGAHGDWFPEAGVSMAMCCVGTGF